MDAAAPQTRYDDREERRRQLLWSGILQTARGPVQCIVIDISRGGARLTAAAAVKIGQAVSL
jgi:predicted phosphoribosyltransferase